MQPRALVCLLATLAACNHSEPPTSAAASTKPAAKPAASAPSAPPSEAGEHSPGATQWPGVVTDLTKADALYEAQVIVPATTLRRKPKNDADTIVPLHRGHIVEVLAEAGPDVSDGGTTSPVWPARFAGFKGWVRADALERLKVPPPDLRPLWDSLRKTPAGEGLPDDCPLGGIFADLAPSEGDELVVIGAGPEPCQKVLGVFARDRKLLGWLRTDVIHELQVRPYPGVPGFLDTTRYWVRAPQHTGTGRALYRVASTPGPLVAALDASDQVIDARTKPIRYTISRFAFPPSDSGFYVQQRKTVRVVTGPDMQADETEELFFRYDGERFVSTPAPPGVAPLPREKPGIVAGP